MSTQPSASHGPVQVTVVESPGCHYCADAHEALDRLVEDGHAIDVHSVDLREPAGQELMRRHRAGMSPLVLVDGVFFSQGRLPRRKLAKVLAGASPRGPLDADRS